MESVLAPRLPAGATIGIVAPSAPVTGEARTLLDRGRAALQGVGFKTRLAPSTLSTSLGYSASAQEKAADINQMFADSSIQAIFCAQGGQNANSVLPLLDYTLIRKHPKIFFGISDISVLLNGIYAKTGLVVFHGNDVIWGFGRGANQYEVDALRRTFVEAKLGPIPKNSVWRTARGSGTIEGKLLGGNLTCLGKIIGTEYLPDCTDAILFLEDYGEEGTADRTSCAMHHLDQAGIFRQIRGLVLGYYKSPSNVRLTDVANEIVGKYDFPIIQTNDFGHNTPNTILPVGGYALLDADKSELSLTRPYLG